jgi:hypothetical protein
MCSMGMPVTIGLMGVSTGVIGEQARWMVKYMQDLKHGKGTFVARWQEMGGVMVLWQNARVGNSHAPEWQNILG